MPTETTPVHGSASRYFGGTHTTMHMLLDDVKEEDLIAYMEEADLITPDPDDVMYFALALKLNCSIWSNDKKLKHQDKIKVYFTEELVKELD